MYKMLSLQVLNNEIATHLHCSLCTKNKNLQHRWENETILSLIQTTAILYEIGKSDFQGNFHTRVLLSCSPLLFKLFIRLVVLLIKIKNSSKRIFFNAAVLTTVKLPFSFLCVRISKTKRRDEPNWKSL